MKKALIVYGGWDGHEPVQCKDIFVELFSKEGWEVRTSDTLDAYLNKDLMADLDVIIPLWTMGAIQNEQFNALNEAVRGGVGLAGWHGGMCDAFRQNTEYQFMTGGQWVSHPGGVIDYTVENLSQEDSVTRGLSSFKMHSEQYYMHTDPGNVVLATTTFAGDQQGYTWVKGTVMPVVWKRMWGKGRIFYSSLGHVASDFEVPEAKEIQRRGTLWAAGVSLEENEYDLLKG